MAVTFSRTIPDDTRGIDRSNHYVRAVRSLPKYIFRENLPGPVLRIPVLKKSRSVWLISKFPTKDFSTSKQLIGIYDDLFQHDPMLSRSVGISFIHSNVEMLFTHLAAFITQ